MYNATGLDHVLHNYETRYTFDLYYRPRWLYYISIPAYVVAQFVSAHLGRFMDMYVGHCSSRHSNMTVLDANGLRDAVGDDDTASED